MMTVISRLVPATILVNILGASLAAPSAAQAVPEARAHHRLAYDPVRQRVLLTGGSTPRDSGRSFTFFNDLWAFDGSRWSALPSSGRRVSGMGLAFDTRAGRMMSFGGYSDGASLADVRALEGNTWVTVGEHPEIRTAEAGFIYDARRNRFVAFGGGGARYQTHGDTWEFDGTSWTKHPAASPPSRQAHVMVYDAKRGRTVVFGGMGTAPQGQRPPALADTWEFDGTTWVERTVEGPSPRIAAGSAYDSRRGLVILFGGTGNDSLHGDTWSWDGTEWRRLATTGPEPRSMGYMAYDAARDRIVLFGGRKGYPDGDLDDTWEWDGAVWRRVDP